MQQPQPAPGPAAQPQQSQQPQQFQQPASHTQQWAPVIEAHDLVMDYTASMARAQAGHGVTGVIPAGTGAGYASANPAAAGPGAIQAGQPSQPAQPGFAMPTMHTLALNHVNFTLREGETVAVMGPSGSGKSTLLHALAGIIKPTAGTVTYDGKDISGFKGKELLDFRRHVQPVFQNPYGSLDPMYSIYRSIEEPLRIHGIGDKKSRAKRVRELIDMVELPESVMSRYPNELSGGQRQRIAIARAMALDPDVIVCDEAVSALDVLVQDQVLRLLNDLQAEKGLSYLFITHDLAVVRQIADEVVVMQHGKLVEHATTDEVFDHPKKQYTRDLLDAIPGGKLQLGLD